MGVDEQGRVGWGGSEMWMEDVDEHGQNLKV